MSDSWVGELSCPNSSSGLIQGIVPAEEVTVADRGIVLRSTETVARPKSAIIAVLSSPTREYLPVRVVSELEGRAEITQAYPFEVSVDNPEVVKVAYARHDLRQLGAVKNSKYGIRKKATGLTSCKRFAPGLDLAYSITFPFCIQADTMRKQWRSVENETPNSGKTLG